MNNYLKTLDKLIVEKVFNLPVSTKRQHGQDVFYVKMEDTTEDLFFKVNDCFATDMGYMTNLAKLERFSSSLQAAFLVVEELKKSGVHAVVMEYNTFCNDWACEIRAENGLFSSTEDGLALAIVLSALKFKGITEKELDGIELENS